MALQGVRIQDGVKARTVRPAAAGRRRPQQSRALHTSQALQDAFVRLLVEREFVPNITIREIVTVAGTGLGSFYEYFSSKEDLIRVCLHLRAKSLLVALREVGSRMAGRPVQEILDAVIDCQMATHALAPQEWRAYYLLERHYSSAESYRKMYDRFVDEWSHALAAASNLPAGFPTSEAARVAQTILYGLMAHTYIRSPAPPDVPALARQARTAIQAYVERVAAA